MSLYTMINCNKYNFGKTLNSASNNDVQSACRTHFASSEVTQNYIKSSNYFDVMHKSQHLQPINQDIFVKSQPIKKNNANKILALGISAVALGVAAVAMVSSKKFKGLSSVRNQKNILERQLQEFPRDISYKKSLATSMNIPENEVYRLRSVIGPTELEYYVDKFSQTPKVYTPGTKAYMSDGSAYFKSIEHVNNLDFGANFHLHTKYSDGHFEVQDLLDKAAEYGDKRFEKYGEPFVFAITDHDAVQGCQEAAEIISQNPFKYKNIRLALGIENTTMVHNPEVLTDDVQVHMISYGINPFSKEIDKFLGVKLRENTSNIKKSISSANSTLSETLDKHNLKYSYDELIKMTPSLQASYKNATYFLKDYLQFRLIFASMFETNTKLKTFLQKSTGLNLEKVDFLHPISKISKTPDCSNGKLYCEYYYDALKQHVVDIAKADNPKIEKTQILENFGQMPDYIKNVLREIEYKTMNTESSFHVPDVVHPSLSSATRELAAMDDVTMSIAHPGIFFPKKAIKKDTDVIKLYDDIYNTFKANGGDKAKYAENHYQIYWNNNNPEVMRTLPELSKKYGLKNTGGLDTHKTEIYETDN